MSALANESRPESKPRLTFLDDGGELGLLMRNFNWEETSLGHPSQWPLSLKTAVRILLTSQQPMFVWWGHDYINLYNDPYRSILGGKHPNALGRPASLVWGEIWDQVGPRAQSTISLNKGTYDEALFLMINRNGYPEETYYTFSYSPIPNDEGETFGIFCANTDETQRIISQRRLGTQRELAAMTSNTMSVANACSRSIEALATNPHDLPFTLLYLKSSESDTFCLMGRSGLPSKPQDLGFEDPAAWPLTEVFAAAKSSVIDLSGSMHLPKGAWECSPSQVALLPIHPAGQVGPSAILITGLNPHRLYDDSYRDFLSLLANQIGAALTSARAYEDERQRTLALEQLDRAKTTFFSNISHEFRTPLTLMLGPLEDLIASEHERSFDAITRGALEIIQRNAVRLQKLVNALLDFSRIEAGRMSTNLQLIDLAAFTAELASLFSTAMERADLKFTVECAPLSKRVYVDPLMWERIVLNLLSNALKYTFGGGVSLRLEETGDSVILSISDTGTGIPESELPRLFERFHRVEGARGRTHEGTGIGLALVQELTRLHGGTVNVASKLGEGSQFTISIPFRSAAADGNASEPPSTSKADSKRHSPLDQTYVEEALQWLPRSLDVLPTKLFELSEDSGSSRFEKGRVLLAEDNPDMRSYIQRLLETEYEVLVAANGKDAFQIATDKIPDLILSDVMMPELDGFGLLKALRAHPTTRSVPVVFLSARAGEEAIAEGREAGADDYIVKPFTSRELLARVKGTMLIGRENRRSIEQLNQIFKQAPVAILVLRGRDFIVELANSSYRDLLQGRDLVGRPLAEVAPDVGQHVWDALTQVLSTGETFVAAEWHVPYDYDRDGVSEDHWFNLVYNPWRDTDGHVSGVIAVLTDVTAQVQARKELERVNRELEEFAYVASHDLQEPLRMVNIYSKLLVQRMGKVEPEKTQEYIGFIETGIHRMEGLIRDLLSFARTVQSEAPSSQAVSLQSCLDTALTVLRPQLDEKKATVEADELPIVKGDDLQLPQLFQNLLSNAIKYSKPHSIPVIHIASRRNGNEWTISVQDNGIGFDQSYGDHIFGLFKRLHKEEYEGTGLGLAICKRIVERLGGRIWVESKPGEGSTFFFTLLAEG